jgi:regulator of nonsense transcripts 3
MSNGVLPASITLLQKNRANSAQNTQRAPLKRANLPRLKTVIRRLPPGLSQAEFEAAIGAEWKVGNGNVDWYIYRVGKVSKDAAKPSRPSRAYLHLTDAALLNPLAEKVRQTEFKDAKSTGRDTSLTGPPAVEFAPSNKIPQNRKRKDARQGTIDQDPEFIAFLEGLTNPIQKPPADLEGPLQKEEKIKTTPLIEHIREKKAARDKPTSTKATLKGGRGETREGSKDRRKGKEGIAASPEKSKRLAKADRLAKEAVEVSNRQASAQSSSQAPEKAPPSATTRLERRRDRGAPLNLAAKIQRDLGIVPAAGRRGGKREKSATPEPPSSSTAEGSVPKENATSTTTPPSTSSSKPPRAPRHRVLATQKKAAALAENTKPDQSSLGDGIKPKAPAAITASPTILKKPNTSQQKLPVSAPQPSKSLATPPPASPALKPNDVEEPTTNATPSTSGHRAFLKHANPSQGITEVLIEDALSKFGAITHVEIDKRKGFAYVDFAKADSLQTAVKAGKVDVAKGAVQILKFHDKSPKPTTAAGIRGGYRGGGGRRNRGVGNTGAGASASTPVASSATTTD